jgi:hypothetical protein
MIAQLSLGAYTDLPLLIYISDASWES